VIGCRGVLATGTETGGRLSPGGSAPADTATEVEAGRAQHLIQWATWDEELSERASSVITPEYESLRQRLAALLQNPGTSLRELTTVRDAARRELLLLDTAVAANAAAGRGRF
jgi:hypothetical protein